MQLPQRLYAGLVRRSARLRCLVQEASQRCSVSPGAATPVVAILQHPEAGLSGAEWLELLCKHIPDRYDYLVRNKGCHSS